MVPLKQDQPRVGCMCCVFLFLICDACSLRCSWSGSIFLFVKLSHFKLNLWRGDWESFICHLRMCANYII